MVRRVPSQNGLFPDWPHRHVTRPVRARRSAPVAASLMRSASPAHDATEVTAGEVREVVARIIAAGHWHAVTQVAAPIVYSSLAGLRARQPVRAASA